MRGWTGGSQQRRLLRVVIVRTPEPKRGAVHGGTVEALYTKHDVISLIASYTSIKINSPSRWTLPPRFETQQTQTVSRG